MSVSLTGSVLVASWLVGCASGVQGGLANAPALGGETPETRVLDAVANGRDSCERSAFPPGEVLRGQLPPCYRRERAAGAGLPSNLPDGVPAVSPYYPASVCRRSGPGLVGGNTDMSVSTTSGSPPGELVCGFPL